MLKIIIALVILCAAVFLGPRLADSQGFVHIATNNYIIESSLTTAVIVLLIAFIILHFVVNLINRSVRLPSSTAKWLDSRKVKKQQNLHNEAFLAYEEGAYSRALALLKKAGPRSDLPVVCQFLGAKCAFQLGDLGTCRNFLDLSEKNADATDVACKLLRAKLNLRIGNAQAAMENIEAIKKDSYTKDITSKLLFECYAQEGKMDEVIALLPYIKKHKLVPEAELQNVIKSCTEFALENATDSSTIHKILNELDRNERNNPDIMAPILIKLVSLGDINTVSKHAIEILNNGVTDDFLLSISKWSNEAPSVLDELTRLANSNNGNQSNLSLLKALSNLEIKSGKLKEAQGHLTRALEIAKDSDLYILAAELNERLGKYEDAAKFFSLALKNR